MTDAAGYRRDSLSIDQQLDLRTAQVRSVRDELERRVRQFPDELAVPAAHLDRE